MSKRVLIVLGAENSATGELGLIALSRLNKCLKLYEIGDLILCTGGWGNHFNTAKKAHAIYAQNYLIEKGIPEASFLEPALSVHTVDDAVKVKEIIEDFTSFSFTLVSSDLHIERVQLIFGEILNDYNFSFIGVEAPISEKEFLIRKTHEKEAVKSILKKGLYY